MAGLTLHQVTKRYNRDITALQQVSLALDKGTVTVVVGPSGSGKTTLLRVVAGLENATEGEVLLGGHNITHWEPCRRNIAMVFQQSPLYPHLSVYHNIAFPLKMAREPKAKIRQSVQEVARWLGIDALLRRKPATLSAGQRQRVGIGKALVRQARLTLFDEPLSHVDAPLRSELRGKIKQYCRDRQLTCLWVTHDQLEAVQLADQLCVLNAGRIQQIGTPAEVLRHPANTFVSEFFITDYPVAEKS